MENLYQLFRNLLDRTDTTFLRYLHGEINWGSRMTAIVGARGVGKTTMLLQRIKLHHDLKDTLYVNADDFYFSDHKLFDLASEFYKNGGKHLFIDEVHKYPQWSKELKMMYDYFPDMKIVFTGSSILDIYKGTDDLSRRALTYTLAGMSFREFLHFSLGLEIPAYSLEEILHNNIELPPSIPHPLPLFKEYLAGGYYPFFRDVEYDERIRNIISLTLETDIPAFANMNVSSARKLKQLLYIISRSVPFKPNFTKIAEMIDVSRNLIGDYFYYLEKAEIISQLRTESIGIRSLGKVDKVYLGNTNLMHAISENKPDTGNMRETFFLGQMEVKNNVYASDAADFTIGEYTFEVGGKGKNQKQIAGLDKAYIVKDDIEYGHQNILPLWAFGFNY